MNVCARLIPSLALPLVLLWTAACSGPPGSDVPPEATVQEGVEGAAQEVDLSHWFEGIDPADATFVVFDAGTGVTTRFNPSRAREGFLPASTFKVPHALIALETGVADGADFTLEWDGRVPEDGSFWTDSWSRDHTLGSAMDNSVVWYFQEIARRIGPERMQEYLERLRYGNRTMGGAVDRFWLDGALRISPDEQVEFLRRMDQGELEVSPRSVAAVKGALLLEEREGVRLSGKTGTADVTPTREMAWLIGFVERDANRWYFALNMEGEEVWELWGPREPRLELLRGLLREVGALPGG